MVLHRRLLMGLVLGAAVFAALPAAQAQDEVDPTARLREVLEIDPTRPHIDTALVFTNLGNAATAVGMRAWNAEGKFVGAKTVRVPANGLVYVLVSELAVEHGLHHLVGKVVATGRGRVRGSAVLIGGPVTDLPAINRLRRLAITDAANPQPEAAILSHITFPLVVGR